MLLDALRNDSIDMRISKSISDHTRFLSPACSTFLNKSEYQRRSGSFSIAADFVVPTIKSSEPSADLHPTEP